ncbi:MAG: hypothetical protein ABJK37_01805 [Paraglaciecola sp.]
MQEVTKQIQKNKDYKPNINEPKTGTWLDQWLAKIGKVLNTPHLCNYK